MYVCSASLVLFFLVVPQLKMVRESEKNSSFFMVQVLTILLEDDVLFDANWTIYAP